MAYILLALGMAMSIAGLAAMAIGYPMIEIERGWATLITGAVLLSGGLVVVGLGFVVRHLIALRHTLSPGGALPRPAEAPIPQPMVVPTAPTPSMPIVPAAPSLSEPSPFGPATLPQGAAPALAAAVPVAAAALAAGVVHPHDAREAGTEAYPDEVHADNAHAAEVHAGDVHAGDVHAGEPDVFEDHGPEDHVHEPIPEPAHEAATSLTAAPEASVPAGTRPPMSNDDLLDQAFSAFDYEMANGHPPADASATRAHEPVVEPPASDTAHEPPAYEPQTHEPQTHQPQAHEAEAHPADSHAHEPAHSEPDAHEPLVAEAPATAPAEPAGNLAVIGRYDSEGTSYVMYSDGSIEAQSDGGVYRFNSMAELKAFIEG